MLRRFVLAATVLLVAAPLWAQTPPADPAQLGPRTLVPAHLLCADLPISSTPASTVSIAGGQNGDGRESLVKGDVVILNAGTTQNLAVGQRFLVRRYDGGALARYSKKDLMKATKAEQKAAAANKPAPTERSYGAVRTAGWITVTAVNETTALAMIDFACDPIGPGDYVETFVEPTLPATVEALGEPQFGDRAKVLFGTDRRVSFADGDLLSIDRGTAHGVVAGARYAFYRDRHNGLPLVHIGDSVVVETEEKTSKVVVVMVVGAIAADDIAVPRRVK